MNRIIKAEKSVNNGDEFEDEIQSLPEQLQKQVVEMIHLMKSCKYDETVKMAEELEPKAEDPGIIREIHAIALFLQGKMHEIMELYESVIKKEPQNAEACLYYGMAAHAEGQYQTAVEFLQRIYPLEKYTPFYYSAYADSLQNLEQFDKSNDIFHELLDKDLNADGFHSDIHMDGVYENVLNLDVVLNQKNRLKDDLKLYINFIEKSELTKELRDHIAATVSFISCDLAEKWFRPYFLELLQFIQDHEVLTSQEYGGVIQSGYCAYESYLYHADSSVSYFMENYLGACHNKTFDIDGEWTKYHEYTIDEEFLRYQWFMSLYYSSHKKEIKYVQESYPYCWKMIQPYITPIQQNSEFVGNQLLHEMFSNKLGGFLGNEKEFERYMMSQYRDAVKNEKMREVISFGMDTYVRNQPKIDRNAPCPCGSGKKYKKCCGR